MLQRGLRLQPQSARARALVTSPAPGVPLSARARHPRRQLTRNAPCAAASGDGWSAKHSGGEARPDTMLGRDQDVAGPGPQSDLDAEWQAFIGSGRFQAPGPLIWDAGSSSSSSLFVARDAPGSSGPEVAGPGPVFGAGTAASQQPGAGPSPAQQQQRYSSSIQSFDDWDFSDDDAIPVPCNLPVNEAIVRSAGCASSAAAAAAAAAAPAALGEVFVLLFGVGSSDTEGIYSLRALSDEGLPTETIIAFEAADDAARYAGLLEATMEHCPHVCSIPPPELLAFCADAGYRCRLELAGSLLMPPDFNVHVTDWERSLRLREGKFAVLPEEPQLGAPSGSGSRGAAGVARAGAYSVHNPWLLPARAGSSCEGMSQLDSVKAQLEALLPPKSGSLDELDAA